MNAEHEAWEKALAALEADEGRRAELREAHRLLEQDLFRLADPLPPPGFLDAVMARVAAAPARLVSPREVAFSVALLASCAAALAGLLMLDGGQLAALLRTTREAQAAGVSLTLALMNTAGATALLFLGLLFGGAVAGLRRMLLSEATS